MAACVFVAGCSKGSKQECPPDLTAERDRLRQENHALQARVTDLEGEIAAQTVQLAELRNTGVISDEHELLERARSLDDEVTWMVALKDYETFAVHYPKSASSRFVEQRLKALRKRQAQVQKEEQEQAAAAELDSLRISDIFADLSRYRGKTIRRSVKCDSIMEDFRKYPFYSSCRVVQDETGGLLVRYSNEQVKSLASLQRDSSGDIEYEGYFRVLGRFVSDIDVEFAGLVE
jgi:hypothetical protein